MLCVSFQYQFTTVTATVRQLVRWSHELFGFHGFSDHTGSPVTADCCFAAQNFKKKQCKDGVSCSCIRSYLREADEVFCRSLFLPMMSCLLDWIGDSVLDSCQSWCLLLNLRFASVIFISNFLSIFICLFFFVSCAHLSSALCVASSFWVANLSLLSWSPHHVQRYK